MRAGVRHYTGRAYARAVAALEEQHMDRDAIEDEGRRDEDRRRVDNVGADEPGIDDEEFSSVEDVGTPPAENPAVDDV